MATFVDTTTMGYLLTDVTLDTATTSLLNTCIDQAENEIRKMLSKRYDVSSDYFQTTTAVPPAVRTIAQWYTQGLMYENLSRGGSKSFERADRFLKKAKDNLVELATFKADLFDTIGGEISDNADLADVKSTTENYIETFAEDDPLNWDIDTDKLDDIDSDRS